MSSLADRKPLLFSLAISAVVLALTADERVFGLITDGQIMTRTAYSMVELGELGIAKGHPVDIARPEGDAVTRYGMGPSLARILPVWLARSFEAAFGTGSSQTLFVLEQVLLVLAAAGAAGALARAWGAPASGQRRAVLACAFASPLWAYASSDFSEPLQAAALGGSFAFAALSRGDAAGEKRASLYCVLAGACAGAALLSKSIFIVLLPVALLVVAGGAPGARRIPRALACLAGWAPLAGLWLAFEIARFGRPFASYAGEHFNHPPLDGLWRLTVGPNKGLLLYFPLAVLSVPAWKRLFPKDRAGGVATLGFTLFLLLATAAWWSWDGAAGWGPRLLVPLVPLLAALAGFVSVSLPAAVFRAGFGLGMAVNAIGVLQPDGPTTWYYMVLPPKPLTAEQAQKYAAYAILRDADGTARLGQWFDVSNHAALSQIRVSLWLLSRRLAGGDVLKQLRTPPWSTDVPGQEVVTRPEEAIPDSALVFLTSPFRWPHLGMSLTRRADQLDTVLSYVDCLYDQALRAQDMRLGERAVSFAEELWRRVPGPQSATALAEGYRIAGRKETLAEFVRSVPAAWRGSPEWGIVVALWFRDRGEDEKAVRTLGRVVEIAPRPELRRLLALPPREWPTTLREIQLAPVARSSP